jgi:ApaG protein
MTAEDDGRGAGVEVSVEATFSPPHSEPGRLFYVYEITILNAGPHAVRLLERHWLITDGEGRDREVHGEGVVGQTPRLRPGEAFRYASGVPIPAAPGLMRGHYVFEDERGGRFRVSIPAFALPEPGATRDARPSRPAADLN